MDLLIVLGAAGALILLAIVMWRDQHHEHRPALRRLKDKDDEVGVTRTTPVPDY